MKCNCGDQKCTTTVQTDTSDDHAILVMARKEGDRTIEILAYLTPNDIVELIRKLKGRLKNIIDRE